MSENQSNLGLKLGHQAIWGFWVKNQEIDQENDEILP